MIKDNRIYSELAKKLVDYVDEPSGYKREKMMCSINGSLGAMRKKGNEREAMALEEVVVSPQFCFDGTGLQLFEFEAAHIVVEIREIDRIGVRDLFQVRLHHNTSNSTGFG